MAKHGQDERGVEQEFSAAVRTAQDALIGAMAAVQKLGKALGQLIEEIIKSRKAAEQALSETLVRPQSRSEEAWDAKPFAQALDAKIDNASATLPRRSAEQENQLIDLNLKATLVGSTSPTEKSRQRAEEVIASLDTKLSAAATMVKGWRETPAPVADQKKEPPRNNPGLR